MVVLVATGSGESNLSGRSPVCRGAGCIGYHKRKGFGYREVCPEGPCGECGGIPVRSDRSDDAGGGPWEDAGTGL